MKRRDAANRAAAAAAAAKKLVKHAKEANNARSKRRDSGLPPAPRINNMHDASFAPNADVAAVIATVEGMPLLSGHHVMRMPVFLASRLQGT